MAMTNSPIPLPPFETLWTPRDVAAFLQVSRSWVYAKAESGLLPALRVGGLLRFDPAKVRAWVAAESARVVPLMPRSGR
mgnify:CR=1 FL=1